MGDVSRAVKHIAGNSAARAELSMWVDARKAERARHAARQAEYSATFAEDNYQRRKPLLMEDLSKADKRIIRQALQPTDNGDESALMFRVRTETGMTFSRDHRGDYVLPARGDVIESKTLARIVELLGYRIDKPLKVSFRKGPKPLADHASRAVPMMPHMGSFPDSVGNIVGTAGESADGAKLGEIWQAFETIVRNGSYFRNRVTGETTRIPFNAISVSRALNGAYKGTAKREKLQNVRAIEVHMDRIDDVIQSGLIRGYILATLAWLGAEAGDHEFIYVNPGDAGQPEGYAPMGNVQGILMTRYTKCGECAPCRKSGDGYSRFAARHCMAPNMIKDYVDAQRFLSRGLFAAASTINGRERYAPWGLQPWELADDDARTDESAYLLCGHGEDCTRATCLAYLAVHTARIATEVYGDGVIGKNGKLSTHFTGMCALLLGQKNTPYGRLTALKTIRYVFNDARVLRSTARRIHHATDIAALKGKPSRARVARPSARQVARVAMSSHARAFRLNGNVARAAIHVDNATATAIARAARKTAMRDRKARVR